MTSTTPAPETVPVLGLRQNLAQFSLLVLVTAFVGGMVGLERAILPLIAEREFGLVSKSVILSFIVGFGFVKAFTNLAAGRFSDRIGRKGTPRRGLDRRPACSLHVDVGPVLGMDHCRQSPPGNQPGVVLVDHGHHEDRPCGAAATGFGDGAE